MHSGAIARNRTGAWSGRHVSAAPFPRPLEPLVTEVVCMYVRVATQATDTHPNFALLSRTRKLRAGSPGSGKPRRVLGERGVRSVYLRVGRFAVALGDGLGSRGRG